MKAREGAMGTYNERLAKSGRQRSFQKDLAFVLRLPEEA